MKFLIVFSVLALCAFQSEATFGHLKGGFSGKGSISGGDSGSVDSGSSGLSLGGGGGGGHGGLGGLSGGIGNLLAYVE